MWAAVPGFSASVTLRRQTGPRACSASILPTEPSVQPFYPLKNYTVSARFTIQFREAQGSGLSLCRSFSSQEKSDNSYTKRWGSSSTCDYKNSMHIVWGDYFKIFMHVDKDKHVLNKMKNCLYRG